MPPLAGLRHSSASFFFSDLRVDTGNTLNRLQHLSFVSRRWTRQAWWIMGSATAEERPMDCMATRASGAPTLSLTLSPLPLNHTHTHTHTHTHNACQRRLPGSHPFPRALSLPLVLCLPCPPSLWPPLAPSLLFPSSLSLAHVRLLPFLPPSASLPLRHPLPPVCHVTYTQYARDERMIVRHRAIDHLSCFSSYSLRLIAAENVEILDA